MTKLNPDNRSNIVRDALKHFASTIKSITPSDILVDKAARTTESIRATIKPILAAGGWKDKDALQLTIHKLYLDGFTSYDKEELRMLCVMLHSQIMMETIEASPYGNDKPDLLSGK